MENRESDKLLEESLRFQLTNLEILGAEGESSKVVNVPPGGDAFIVIKVVDPGKGFSFGYGTRSRVRTQRA